MQSNSPVQTSGPFRLFEIRGAEAIPLIGNKGYCASILQVNDRFPGAILPETLRRTQYIPLDDGRPPLPGLPDNPLFGTAHSTLCRKLFKKLTIHTTQEEFICHLLYSDRCMTLERRRNEGFYLVFCEGTEECIGSIHKLDMFQPVAWLYKPHHPALAKFMHPIQSLSNDMVAPSADQLLQSMIRGNYSPAPYLKNLCQEIVRRC